MKTREEVPDYLHATYDMLKCVFPDGIPEEEYWSVMVLIHPFMSFGPLADTVCAVMDKNRYEIYNDASGFGLDPMPDASETEKVKQKLDACGYAAWAAKNTFPPYIP